VDQVWIFLGILVALALIGGLVTYFVGGRSPRGPDGDERTVPPQIEDRTRPTSELPKDRVDEPGLTVPIDAPMTTDEALEAISEAREQDDAEGVIAPAKVPSMRDRLSRARSGFGGYLRSIRSRNKIDSDTWDELEEALIRADVGVSHTQSLLEAVRDRIVKNRFDHRVREDFLERGEGRDEVAAWRATSRCTPVPTPAVDVAVRRRQRRG
jgi:fused signal recognition particle receptor